MDIAYLVLALVAFLTFIVVLAGVQIYVLLGDRAAARARNRATIEVIEFSQVIAIAAE
jgi:hypothetical protein